MAIKMSWYCREFQRHDPVNRESQAEFEVEFQKSPKKLYVIERTRGLVAVMVEVNGEQRSKHA